MIRRRPDGLLLAVAPASAKEMLTELQAEGMPAEIVGEVLSKTEKEITVVM